MRNAAARIVSRGDAGQAPAARGVAAHVRLSARSDISRAVSPSGEIFIDIVVENGSRSPLCWPDGDQINLSYHWIDASSGEVVIFDGARSALKEFIPAGEKRTIAVSAFAPDHELDAILRVSLVYEDQFWFDELFPETALDLPVRIVGRHWVDAASATRAERAMRGSAAAVALAIACEAAAARTVGSPEGASPPAAVPPTAPAPGERRGAGRLAAGVRRASAAALSPFLWLRRPLARRFAARLGVPGGRGGADLDARTRALVAAGEQILSRLDQAQALNERLVARLDDVVRLRDSAEVRQSRTLELARSSSEFGQKALLGVLQSLDRIAALEALTASVGDAVERRADRSDALGEILGMKLDHLGALGEARGAKLDHLAAQDEVRSAKQDQLAALDEMLSAKLDRLLARHVITLPDGLILCRNPHGLLAVPSSDAAAVAYLSDGVLPEAGALSVIERLLPRGGCFVDVGANVGLFTLFAGRRVGARGRVVAFEPTPSTLRALHTTIRVNGLRDRVTVHEVAAGAAASRAVLHFGATCGHNSLLGDEGGAQGIEVPVARVDDLLDGRAVDMVKIDVEGWELSVLEGMSRTLAANPDIVLIIEFAPSIIARSGVDVQTWLRRLKTYEFNIFEIDEGAGELRRLRSRGLGEVHSINLLLTRKTRAALGKVAA